jgi:hypothetical protein
VSRSLVTTGTVTCRALDLTVRNAMRKWNISTSRETTVAQTKTNEWNRMASVQPRAGQTVEVLYDDGVQCLAKYVGGQIFYPEGSSMYRYVNVTFWRNA